MSVAVQASPQVDFGDAKVIGPQPGPQVKFLTTPADIAILGGAAGGGKTWALVYEPLRHVGNPDFGAVIFRRTYPEIMIEGGMWDEAGELYIPLGAASNQAHMEFVFPSGATVQFAHMQHEKDKYNYFGSQIPLIEYDQLEMFTESQFFWMMSRNRSNCGVAPYIRGTCNPDPDSFLAGLLAWWIDQDTGYAIPERSGQLRWFVRRPGGELDWDDDPVTLSARYADELPTSVTFIPADVYDNPAMLERNPAYVTKLKALPPVERERLLGGNWKVKPAAGKIVNRAWFGLVEAVPAGGECLRFWDFAATQKQVKGDDPDYTAGVRMRKSEGLFFVDDVVAGQWNPAEGDRNFINITRQDLAHCLQTKTRYGVRWEVEPGSASIRENRRLVSMLAQIGIPAGGTPAPGRKDPIIRGRAFASAAEVGNIKVLRTCWTEAFLNHLHAVPDGKHDDIWEATLGCYNGLAVMGSRAATTAKR